MKYKDEQKDLISKIYEKMLRMDKEKDFRGIKEMSDIVLESGYPKACFLLAILSDSTKNFRYADFANAVIESGDAECNYLMMKAGIEKLVKYSKVDYAQHYAVVKESGDEKYIKKADKLLTEKQNNKNTQSDIEKN